MAKKDIIVMGHEEFKRLSIIEKILAGAVTQVEAAGMLSLSDRQVRRIVRRVCNEGATGIIHKSRGKPSHRAVSKRIKQRVIRLCKGKYEGFNPTFASDDLPPKNSATCK